MDDPRRLTRSRDGARIHQICDNVWCVYGPVLVIEDVLAQKECCGANHPYQCQGEDLLSADDWIDIEYGPLATLVKRYVKHLGKESYFELF